MACLSKIVVACMVLGAGAMAHFGDADATDFKCKWNSDMRGDLKEGEDRSCVPESNDGEYDEKTCHCGTGRTCVAVYDASKYNGNSKYRCELPECKLGSNNSDYSTPKKCLADGEENNDTDRCACPENHQCKSESCVPKCGSDSNKCDEECYCSEGTTCTNIPTTDGYNTTSTAKKCMLPQCAGNTCDDSCSCVANHACHAASNSSGSDTCMPVCSISSNDTRLTANETCSGDNATCTCGSGKTCEKTTEQYGNAYMCVEDIVVEADNSTKDVNATLTGITETAVECSSVSGSNTTVDEFKKACGALTAECEAVIVMGSTNCSATDACKCKKTSYVQKVEDAQVSSAQKCFSWFAVLVMILQL